MYRFGLITALFIMPFVAQAQQRDKDIDSLHSCKTLEEVIVVGQHNPQSVQKAVYNVSVIKNKKIVQLAATSLEDVLRQSLNIKVVPNPKSGKNSISLFGLDGEYVKVLVDNIPIVNDEGYGNNIDLSQINLDDVEQIEIVEGAMAVEYGANAVAGVINIVTKQKAKKKFTASVSVLEETVGKEFEFYDKGKHVQSARLSAYLTDKLFSSATFNRTDFGGYYKNKQGAYYIKNDGLRGHEWLPREQYNSSLLLKAFDLNGWGASYRFSFMHDAIDRYNPSIQNIRKSTALDRQYISKRLYHNLIVDKQVGAKSKLHINFSLQEQVRHQRDYTFYIKQDKRTNEREAVASKMKVFSALGHYAFESPKAQFKGKLGYDIGIRQGAMSGLAILSASKDLQEKALNHYDVYGFSEYQVLPRLSLRAGVRGMFSQLFPAKMAYNVSAKYVLDRWQFRFVFGNSPRNPNFEELYTSFVDVNHNVVGNMDLKAETAKSLSLSVKKSFCTEAGIYNSVKLSANYLDVKDRITWVAKKNPNTPRDTFMPVNIDRYKAFNISLSNKFRYKFLDASVGVMYLSTAQVKNSEAWSDDYLPSMQLNSSLSLRLPYDISFSAYYKYNGKEMRFAYIDDELRETSQEAYHWLDASFQKDFWNKQISLIIGARNITNTTDLKAYQSGGAHSNPSTRRQFAYGRSYFAKLIFKF